MEDMVLLLEAATLRPLTTTRLLLLMAYGVDAAEVDGHAADGAFDVLLLSSFGHVQRRFVVGVLIVR